MSTRSGIGIINNDNSIDIIYCHHDGYPDHNGRILIKNYENEQSIRQLLSLGNTSGLEEDGYSLFYTDGNNNASHYETYNSLILEQISSKFDAEYIYLFDLKTNK